MDIELSRDEILYWQIASTVSMAMLAITMFFTIVYFTDMFGLGVIAMMFIFVMVPITPALVGMYLRQYLRKPKEI